MAALSSILAWRIPWTEKPGGLRSTQQNIKGQYVLVLKGHLLFLTQQSLIRLLLP